MPSARLVAALVAQLGSRQAHLELKWMKQHPHRDISDMLTRRTLGEPLQYVLGTQPFGPLSLLVRPPVLIPRPETEHWVINLASRIRPSTTPKSLIDLGTGSGCIPLLLSHLLPPGSLHAHGIDISLPAIHLAQDNAVHCGVPSHRQSSHHNTFKPILASFLDPTFAEDRKLTPPYDILTSNPPYIPWNEYLDLPSDVIDYEDPRALFGGPSGLDFYHAIAGLIQRKDFLRPGGLAALEVGHGQARSVEHIMRTLGRRCRTEIWSDPWGKQRAVIVHL